MIKEIIGKSTLYLARCEDVVSEIGAVDALVTDPPYEFRTSGGGKMRAERKCLEKIVSAGLDQGFDFQIINSLLYRSAVVFCHNDQVHKLAPFLAGSYKRHAICFWEKNNPMPVANKHYMPDLEIYFHAWNDGGHPVGALKDKKRTIKTNNGQSEFNHPTVKPLAVMDKIMRNVNGDSVIDPFMGTGTTGISAINHGKSFFGVECNPAFFDIACRRIEFAEKEKRALTLTNQ